MTSQLDTPAPAAGTIEEIAAALASIGERQEAALALAARLELERIALVDQLLARCPNDLAARALLLAAHDARITCAVLRHFAPGSVDMRETLAGRPRAVPHALRHARWPLRAGGCSQGCYMSAPRRWRNPRSGHRCTVCGTVFFAVTKQAPKTCSVRCRVSRYRARRHDDATAPQPDREAA